MQQGRFLAADVGPRPHAQLQLQAGARPQKPPLMGLLQGPPQALDRQGVFGPHIDEAAFGANGKGGDRQTFQQPMGIALEHAAVHEGARIALIGVAHHIAGSRRLQGNRVPLEAGGVAGTTAAAQATAAHRGAHRLGAEFGAGWGETTAPLPIGPAGEGIVD